MDHQPILHPTPLTTKGMVVVEVMAEIPLHPLQTEVLECIPIYLRFKIPMPIYFPAGRVLRLLSLRHKDIQFRPHLLLLILLILFLLNLNDVRCRLVVNSLHHPGLDRTFLTREIMRDRMTLKDRITLIEAILR